MAVIQISRVQVRRGQTSQTGFPQLASGEFGWSIDQQELYIGNGSVSEGAPAIGNTRILTEKDGSLFVLSSPSYIYKNGPDGPTVQTGPNENPFISRSLQVTLDDTVNLRKFGGVGDGVTDDTGAIQRAVAYCGKERKVLILDEGTFIVSGEITVPPYAEIRGAGIGKTQIVNVSSSTIFRTVGTTVDGEVTDISSAANTPMHININGVTFQSPVSNADSMLKLDCVQDSTIEKCEFIGNPAIASTSTMANAIELISLDALRVQNLHIFGCEFKSLGTAITSEYNVENLAISHCDFYNLDYGITLAKNLAPGQTEGPEHTTIFRNQFENINNQALYVGQNLSGITTVQSSFNKYINVGIGYNNALGDLKQTTEVITFKSSGNTSQSDLFSRWQVINTNSLSEFTGSIYPIIKGPWNGALGGLNLMMPTGFVTQQLAVVPRGSYTSGAFTRNFQTIEIKYTMNRSSPYLFREGTVTITIDNFTNSATIVDNFNTNGSSDGELSFSVDLLRSDVAVINYTNLGASGTISTVINVRQ